MCNVGTGAEWTPIGATSWKGELVELQQCEHCDDRRAVVLDPDTIPVVQESAPDDLVANVADGESTDSESYTKSSGQSDGPWDGNNQN